MKKVAIIYDWIDKSGGVERLLLVLHEIFPHATFYTSIYDKEGAPWAKSLNITTSWMQKLPRFIRKNRLMNILSFPFAFDSFNLNKYETVISVSSSFAKGVITKPSTYHLNIMLTPPRFLWDMTEIYIKGNVMKAVASPILGWLRKWDFIAGQRPDSIQAISDLVARRCKKIYKRKASVLYPPFSEKYWEQVKQNKKNVDLPENFFLVVSRLEKYKKVDVIIKAFNKTPQQSLVVVGKGNEYSYLKEIAHKNIHFLDEISDEELASCYEKAKALIMIQEEDFGYTALEALFFGCPVITYVHSGAKEIVVEGKTGLYVSAQTVEALLAALERFPSVTYNVSVHARDILKQFSVDKFKEIVLHQLQISK